MTWLQRLRELSPRTILMIGFALFLVYAFPGYMSTDSVAQLTEARTGNFSDGHPPIMAAQWWVLDRIVSGPILMLLLQSTLFLGGLYVLLRRFLTPRGAAVTACAILLFPPVMTPMAVIWKDSQMAAYLVAGTAALTHARPRVRLVGLALLVIAAALRHNAGAAVVPLVFFVFEWRTPIRWWKRVVFVGAASLALVAAALLVTRLLAVEHVRLTPVFPDIVGVIAKTHDRTDEDLLRVLPAELLVHKTNIQARARKLLDLESAFLITRGDDRLFDNPVTPEHWAALERARSELVRGDPVAYVAAHWQRFSSLLGFGNLGVRGTIWNLFLEEPVVMFNLEHTAAWSWAQAIIARVLIWFEIHTPLFTPYVYAFAALLLLALFCRDRLTAGLLTSGLCYELSFFPFAPTPDFRYSHWMITATSIAAVLLFIQRRAGSAPASPAASPAPVSARSSADARATA